MLARRPRQCRTVIAVRQDLVSRTPEGVRQHLGWERPATAEYQDILHQEADLTAGHGLLRATGFVAVSASDPDEAERAVRRGADTLSCRGHLRSTDGCSRSRHSARGRSPSASGCRSSGKAPSDRPQLQGRSVSDRHHGDAAAVPRTSPMRSHRSRSPPTRTINDPTTSLTNLGEQSAAPPTRRARARIRPRYMPYSGPSAPRSGR